MHPGFGVYIHIPFCAKKCDYCAFATFTDRHQLTSDYLTAMRTHIRRSVADSMPKATSVFVGGGTHNPENVVRSVAHVREAGFESFNLDIIYGAAGESISDWQKTVADVTSLDPPHVSAYGLTVEANTALASQLDRHPDDDDQADKYIIVDEIFSTTGLNNYEISNWAKSGHECEHNSLYWQQGNYEGFGSAAHAHLNGRRWWNVRTPERYIELVTAGESPESSSETLDAQTRKREALQLLVRTREGVPIGSFSDGDLDEMSELLEQRQDRIVLTRAGRLLANEVAMRLIDTV